MWRRRTRTLSNSLSLPLCVTPCFKALEQEFSTQKWGMVGSHPNKTCLTIRWPNNHKPEWASGIRRFAEAVQFYCGHRYQRSIDYLQALANNDFWNHAELMDLPFHRQVMQPEGMGGPQYVFHDCVLNALAPAVPLRAVFSRN